MQCPFCNYENIDGVDQCERCSAALTDLSDLAEKSDIELDLLHRPLGEMVAQDFETVEPNVPVREVVSRLKQRKYHYAIILEGDRIAGIFTERDVLYKLADRFDELADSPVRDHMTANPVTLQADDPVAFALNRMMVGGYRHIPVQRDGKLVGVASVRDILGYLVKRFPELVTAGAAS